METIPSIYNDVKYWEELMKEVDKNGDNEVEQ